MCYTGPRSDIFIYNATANYLAHVLDIVLLAAVIFAVTVLLFSFGTKNMDIITILSESVLLILGTLLLYAGCMAFIVSDHEKDKWFQSNHMLSLIRVAFTPVMLAILYFF